VNKETWIVVADGARARFYALRDEKPWLVPALDHDLVATRLTDRDLESDRPGRTTVRGTGMSHGMRQELDKHRLAQLELARGVAKALDTARNAGLARIVLVAPPRSLGDLREACSDEVRALVTNEVAKDFSKLSVHELSGRLDELLQ
jgi:protein required for attachment to host cells